MYLNTSVISIATVVAMLFMNTETSAGIFDRLLAKPGKPDFYQKQQLGEWNAFNQAGLKLNNIYFASNGVDYLTGKMKAPRWNSYSIKTEIKERAAFITCVVPHSFYDKTLAKLYPNIILYNNQNDDTMTMAEIYHSRGYFSFSTGEKKCYVSDSVCKGALSEDVQTRYSLSGRYRFDRNSLEHAITSIANIIINLGLSDIAYDINVNNICFNSEGEVVLLRYDQAKSLSHLDYNAVSDMNINLYAVFDALCKKTVIINETDSYNHCKENLILRYKKRDWLEIYLAR
ncbi:hypothetical protein BDF22DRAFT_669918 [Syncephalis plumigaleata]|nr:hypothetical protein BDF22DRAFT_669918 [Syncephalis plumigaleata]